VLYNIPGNAGNAITPAIADRLADLDNVVAIKESSGDWTNFHDTLLRVKDRIRVYCGPVLRLRRARDARGRGRAHRLLPERVGGLPRHLAHDEGGADGGGLGAPAHRDRHDRALHDRGADALPRHKAAMNFMGLPGGGIPRPPLRELTGAPLAGLEAGMDRLLARPSKVA
jgi:dihydrodipicolinate synthase/N-acetylneuraminate lyase